MTERGRRHVHREAREFTLGSSRLKWDGGTLVVDIDEITAPLPRRLRGRLRLHPLALSPWLTNLDADGRHRWGPIAPAARIEVEMRDPKLSWSGHAYLDSNEGDEPIDRPFRAWDWSRALLSDGSTAVIYDVRPKTGADRIIAQRFAPDGSTTPFKAPPRQLLPASKWWRIKRTIRSDPGAPARVLQTLTDTPFYVRSTISADMLGERVTALHETLSVPRVVSLPVRLMLPWRMPRRG